MIKITQEKNLRLSERNLMLYLTLGAGVYFIWLMFRLAFENLAVACFFLLLYYFNEWQWIKGGEVLGMWIFITLGRITYFLFRRYIRNNKEE